jgi:Calcineurin-like phosphoesterase
LQTNPESPINLSNPPRSRAIGYKSRHVAKLSNVPLLGRSSLMSRFQQAATKTPPDARFPKLLAFFQFWKWVFPYLHDFIHHDAPYQTYPNGKTGIFRIAAPPQESALRIGVAADWGTGTLEAETVADNMKARSPHYTVHLGDVYYMGETPEIDENCLEQPRDGYTGVRWPLGSLGSFALMGNHEMYSGGQGYFKTFLITLGLLNPNKTIRDPQSASYFCLETAHWLVLGLDTGYHSGGVPAFTSIPGLNSIPFLNVDARFDDKMLAWLKQTIDTLLPPGSPKKPILLLTHHQPISSFEHEFKKPAEQLAQLGFLSEQESVWLYGHEHRLTIYKPQVIANSLRVYPRCIGHGGMPVEVTTLSQPDSRILYYDPRKHPIDDQDPDTFVGYNGHVELLFEGTVLKIEYYDIVDNNLLLTETFSPNGVGALQHTPTVPSGSPLFSGQKTS